MCATPCALICRICIYIGLFFTKNVLKNDKRLGIQKPVAIHICGIAKSAYHRFVIDFFQNKPPWPSLVCSPTLTYL